MKYLENLKQTGQILTHIYAEVAALVYVGQTLNNLNTCIGDIFRKYEVVSAIPKHFNFPGNCCLSLNNIACHGVPDDSRLKDTDILKIDIAIKPLDPQEYVADACRTYFLPKAAQKYKNMYAFAQKLVRESIEHIIPDKTTVLEHSSYIHKKIKESNTYKLLEDFCGHFIDSSLHAGHPICYNPRKLVHMNRHRTLRCGDVFTIEPILIYGPTTYRILEDGFSVKTSDVAIQYEDTFLIQDYNVVRIT